jgi:hypothetical protein
MAWATASRSGSACSPGGIGDFLGRRDRHAADPHDRIPWPVGFDSDPGAARAATYSAFAVLILLLGAVFLRQHSAVASLLDVPYIAYPCWYGSPCWAGHAARRWPRVLRLLLLHWATTRGLGPFEDTYQLQTFLALCVLPGAAVTGRDGRAR